MKFLLAIATLITLRLAKMKGKCGCRGWGWVQICLFDVSLKIAIELLRVRGDMHLDRVCKKRVTTAVDIII